MQMSIFLLLLSSWGITTIIGYLCSSEDWFNIVKSFDLELTNKKYGYN